MHIGADLISLLYGVAALLVMPFILRFLLQASKADFYNPLSQFIVRFTNPLAMPIRSILPNQKGFDIASLLLAYGLQAGLMLIVLAVLGAATNWLQVLPWAAIALFKTVLDMYFWGLIISIIASWIAPQSYNPALILINQLLEPISAPIRRIMPDLGGLDLSPIVIMLALQVLEILLIKPLAMLSGLAYFPGLYQLFL